MCTYCWVQNKMKYYIFIENKSLFDSYKVTKSSFFFSNQQKSHSYNWTHCHMFVRKSAA